MRVVLQSLKDSHCLAPDGNWTRQANQALNFGEVVRAVDYILSRWLQNVRAVISFANPHDDLFLPSLMGDAG